MFKPRQPAKPAPSGALARALSVTAEYGVFRTDPPTGGKLNDPVFIDAFPTLTKAEEEAARAAADHPDSYLSIRPVYP